MVESRDSPFGVGRAPVWRPPAPYGRATAVAPGHARNGSRNSNDPVLSLTPRGAAVPAWSLPHALRSATVGAMSALSAADRLTAELARSAPLLLDVRWTLAGPDLAGYRAGHLPGAVFCDLDADLAGPPGAGGRHPLPAPEELAESFRRLGVGPGTSVVVYDGGVAAAAARAWWCLRWLGHEDVRVLDGGLPAWVAAGGSLESGEVSPIPPPRHCRRVPGRCPPWTRTSSWPARRACCWTPGPRSGSAGSPSRWTRWPGTSRGPARCPPRGCWTDRAATSRPRSCAGCWPASGRTARVPWRPTAAPASRPRSWCSPPTSPASSQRSTRARGPTGSPTPPGRWPQGRPDQASSSRTRGMTSVP